MACREVIQNDRRQARIEQVSNDMAADITCATTYKDWLIDISHGLIRTSFLQ
jgi:hypothetical protein